MRRSLLVLTCVLAVSWSAAAVIPEQVPDLPVLTPETAPGKIIVAPAAPIAPSAKTVDGEVSDWTGAPTRLGGTAIYSAGEYVYSDYIGDDWGADDGRDAERLATLDPLRDLEPRTYRLDPIGQVLGDEFGIEGPPLVVGRARVRRRRPARRSRPSRRHRRGARRSRRRSACSSWFGPR